MEVAGEFVEYVTRNAPRGEWALIAKLILDEAFADPVGTRAEDRAEAAAERRQSLLEKVATLKAGEAGRVLAPRAGESRTLVKKLRDEGVLLGLPLGRRPDYHYPAFQFDTVHHRVWPIVAYANRRLGAAEDPWGVTSWWRTPLRHPRRPNPVAGPRGRRSDRDRGRQHDQRRRAGNVGGGGLQRQPGEHRHPRPGRWCIRRRPQETSSGAAAEGCAKEGVWVSAEGVGVDSGRMAGVCAYAGCGNRLVQT